MVIETTLGKKGKECPEPETSFGSLMHWDGFGVRKEIEPLNSSSRLRREKNGIVAGGLGNVVLLAVRSYEVIEPEFHERNMKQVSGPDEIGQPMLFGEIGGDIENLVAINFKKSERPGAQMLLKQGLSSLVLRAGQ